jgi:serine protease Do
MSLAVIGRDLDGLRLVRDVVVGHAPVNKGNSGGPTFDMEGNIIGVNTAIFSPSGGSVGIAFDIPAETVKTVVAQLKDKGMVSRGWIGVQIQPVTSDIAESLGLKGSEGALVAEPQADSPAGKAGLETSRIPAIMPSLPPRKACSGLRGLPIWSRRSNPPSGRCASKWTPARK